MPPLFPVFLGLHLAAVAVAYGSTVLVPFLSRSGAEAAQAPWRRWAELAADRLAIPAAISMPLTGAGLVIVAGINPASQAWLLISIVLYVATLAYLVLRQRPRVIRLLRGEGTPETIGQLRHASIGTLAVILVIGATMIFKPGH